MKHQVIACLSFDSVIASDGRFPPFLRQSLMAAFGETAKPGLFCIAQVAMRTAFPRSDRSSSRHHLCSDHAHRTVFRPYRLHQVSAQTPRLLIARVRDFVAADRVVPRLEGRIRDGLAQLMAGDNRHGLEEPAIQQALVTVRIRDHRVKNIGAKSAMVSA
jgi:hypothetical protein